MKRPDFHAGINPQLDCDIVAQREEAWMAKLEARLQIDCAGCPGCATGDCPDALDVAATTIAALAEKNVRQDHAFAREVEQATEWRNERDELRKVVRMVRKEFQDQDRWRAPELARGTIERVLAGLPREDP